MQRLRAAQLDVRQFRLGGVQLSRRLRDIQIGNDAASPAVLRQFQRAPIRFNRAGNQRVFIVQRAQREIIVRDFGADVQFRGFQIVGAGDKTRVGGFGLPPHAAPQINFPAEINRRGEGVVSMRRAGGLAVLRLVDAGALAVEVAVGRAAGGELRIKIPNARRRPGRGPAQTARRRRRDSGCSSARAFPAGSIPNR